MYVLNPPFLLRPMYVQNKHYNIYTKLKKKFNAKIHNKNNTNDTSI